MTRAALLAEKMNQRPVWFNLYDRLWAALATDAVGGITARRVKMNR